MIKVQRGIHGRTDSRTLLAAACMAGFYYLGRWSTRTNLTDVIESMLSKLETDGFIATKMDENGDKELVPISEVIAKTLKEYKKAS